MGNKEQILELLKRESLTSGEISKRITIREDPEDNKNNIRTYLLRLKKDNLIESTGKKGKHNIYRAKNNDYIEKLRLESSILKKMLPKFIELEVNLEDTTEKEDKRIMELIKECQLI